MVIMLDHCWNERVSAPPFFNYIYSFVPAQIYLFGPGFIRINDSATEGLLIWTLLRMTGHRLTYPLVPAELISNSPHS